MQIRQGDVFLQKIDKLPKGLKTKDNTVAYGEATGHHHTFDNKAKVMVDNNGQQYAIIQQQSELQHQEHENIQVPKGIYRVIQQREYDLVEGVRQVLD